MERLRFILFIPVCVIALGLINWTFMQLLNWTILKSTQLYHHLNIYLFILIIPLFWGTLWGIFKLTAIGLAALLIPVSPDRKFSLYSLGILSLVNCIALIVYYWSRDVQYSWKVILMSLIITGFIVDISASIVLVFSRKESLSRED